MQAEHVDKTPDLRDYFAILRTRKWTVVLVIVVVVGAALGVSFAQTARYTSTARVLVDPGPGEGSDFPIDSVDPLTETEVISSDPVAALVRDDLGIDTPIPELLAELEVLHVPETLVIQVGYTSPDPERARAVAQSFAENYIEYRRAQALENLSAAQQAVEDRIEDATTQLNQLTDDVRAARRAGDETLLQTLESSRSVLLSRLGFLQERLNDLEPSDSIQLIGGDVIQAAETPSRPSSPNYLRNAALAAFLGLTLGIAMALLRERLDDRFRGRDDIEHSMGAPVLATVPKFTGGARKGPSQLVTIAEPRGLASEFYRTVRTNLEFIASQRSLKSILVTSPSAAEGKTVTSANLGVAFAQAGFRVIVVSADLRRPTLEGIFGFQGSPGLASWLQNPTTDLWTYIKDPQIRNLRVLPSGPVPQRPAELLASPHLKVMIEALEANCDYLIFDSPPSLVVADASILASRLDAALLVIDADKTPRSAAIRAKEELERAGGVIVGSILNSFDPSASPYYRYEIPAYYEYPQTAGNGAPPPPPGGPAEPAPKRRSLFRR